MSLLGLTRSPIVAPMRLTASIYGNAKAITNKRLTNIFK